MATPTKAHARVAHSIIASCAIGLEAIIHGDVDTAHVMQRHAGDIMTREPHVNTGQFAGLVRDAYYYLGLAIYGHETNASTIIGYDPLVSESWDVPARKHCARLEGMTATLESAYGEF